MPGKGKSKTTEQNSKKFLLNHPLGKRIFLLIIFIKTIFSLNNNIQEII
jgi:hypothetical protein